MQKRLSLFCLSPLVLAIAFISAPTFAAEKALEKVKVIANPEAEERRTNEIQTIIVNEAEVERYGDATVGDVLRRLPGMSFTGPAGVAKDVRVRGLDKGYTQFLINGEPVPGIAQERQMQVDRLPADMIERIEIIHNPSAEYSAGGIGGTINIILKRKAENLTRLRAAYGKNGDMNVGDVIGQWSHSFDSLDVLLSLSHTVGAEDVIEQKQTFNGATGLLTSAEYKPKPVEKSETLFAPVITWHLGNDKLIIEPFLSAGTEDKLENNIVSNAAGVATKYTNASENKDDEIQRLATRYEAKTDWGKWYVKGGAQQGTQDKDKFTTEANSAKVVTKRAQELEMLDETQNYLGAGADFKPAKHHKIKVGAEYNSISYKKTKTTAEAANATAALTNKAPGQNDIYAIDETKTALYAQDEWHLAKSHWLTGGVRYELIERDAKDRNGLARDSDNNAYNPSLHYRWEFNKQTNIRASLAQTLRVPKFDLVNPLVVTATGANAGAITNPDKAGNADLQPETARGFEMGVEHFFDDHSSMLSLNFYNRDVADYIEKTEKLEGTRYVQRPYNAGDAEFWGTEFELTKQLLRNTHYDLTVKLIHTEMHGRVSNIKTGKTNEVKDMPERITNLGVDWRHTPTRWAAGLSINYTPEFERSSLNDDGVLETKQRNEALLVDMYISKAVNDYVDVRLIGKNLTSIEKSEYTAKFKADGTVNTLEDKAELSEPTVYLTLDSRF